MTAKEKIEAQQEKVAKNSPAWRRDNISTTDFNCVMAAFDKLAEYEKREGENNEK